ncbi:MAG: amidohydrolase family protein [Desulfovibrionaceae bacterium]|jgi:hypothetical protein|nr:amidohydrolase family protein [Desulfovibrionaceae bacterium]
MHSAIPRVVLIVLACALSLAAPARADEPVRPLLTREATETLWRARIQSFLDRGVIPLIDMESSLPNEVADGDLGPALRAMDKEGVALMVCDGYQAEKDGASKGYRWGYAVSRAANRHPDRLVQATNGGTNPNWTSGKGGRPNDFIDQTEVQARSGDYPILAEFEFRHYQSSQQCKKGRTDRDVNQPLDGANGQRLFALSQETGLAVLIHLEPEDACIDALERTLAAYPGARIIACHFGQIRHPGRQTRFGPELVRRLLSTYPNLYYDLSVGEPGRRYACTDRLDTVLWADAGAFGEQSDRLKPDYAKVLTDFSDRFVAGFDYGGGRAPLPGFIAARAANIRLILAGLPAPVRHAISYGNAWRLLTGKAW